MGFRGREADGVRWTGALCVAVVLVAAAAAGPVRAGTFGLELTGAESGLDAADGAAWGFWEPAKYDGWRTSVDDGFDLVEARALFGGEDVTVFFAAELVPALEAEGAPIGGAPGASERLELDIEVYDLAVTQSWDLAAGVAVTPWVGATRILIGERRRVVGGDGDDSAKSRLWGAVVGTEVAVRLTRRVALTGRVVARWAEGDRDAHVAVPDDGDPQVDSAAVSDRVTRLMFGTDLGLRYILNRRSHVDIGWRERSWEERDGPGSVSGAYLRLSFGL